MRKLNGVLGLLCSAALVVVAGTPATAADPAGTTFVNPVATRTTAIIHAASPAGVLYSERAREVPERRWFKPAGAGQAHEVWTGYVALEGNLLFGSWAGAVRWQEVGSDRHQDCASPGGSALHTSTGWISWTWNPGADQTTYWRTTVSGGRCTDQLLGTLPSRVVPVAATANGFALTLQNALWWVPDDDLGLRITIDTDNTAPVSVQVEGSALSWTEFDHNGSRRLFRASTDGGPTAITPIDQTFQAQTRLTVTHTAYVVGRTLGIVPAAGGPVMTRAIGLDSPRYGGVASDGTWFYFVSPDGTSVQRVRSAVDEPQTVLIMPLRPAGSGDLGLGPGRVATTNYGDTGLPQAVRRTFTQAVPPVVGTTPTDLGDANEGHDFRPPVGTSIEQDGRRTAWLGPDAWLRLATEGGATVKVPFPESRADRKPWGRGLVLSGSRLLWTSIEVWPVDNPPPPVPRNAYLYDVRTGANTLLGATTGSDFALWGNYLVRALPNGSITRRDLSTGTLLTVKGPGGPVISVDAHGSWVAWAMCSTADCTSTTVGHRNVNAGTAPVPVPAPHSQTVRLTNNFLYFDLTGADPHRVVRRLVLGTAAPADTGLVDAGNFDAHDETLGYMGADSRARIAPQPAFSARPRFLGGALGAAGFTPNGDGKADTWPVEFPLTKPLPTCAVTIRLNTTVVRTLNCANTNGAASVTWNGRNTAGALVAKGRYTWTLTGSDTDGALLLWNGSATNYTGTVTVN